MTTLSLLPGPLKRLFSRFDAGGTTERSLEMALDHWRIKRGNRLYPSVADIDVAQLGTFAPHVFVFERSGKADWSLRFAGEAAKTMLRPQSGEATLSTLANRRIAARLRLLFAMGRGDRGSRLGKLHISRSVGRDPRCPAQHRWQQGRGHIRGHRFASARLTCSRGSRLRLLHFVRFQYPYDFLIGDLVEIGVMEAEAKEGLGRLQANDVIRLRAQSGDLFFGSNGDGENDRPRLLEAQSFDDGPNSGARGDPVVNDDCRTPGDADARAILQVELCPALNFL